MLEPLYESPWKGTPEWWVNNPGPFIDLCFDHGVTNFTFMEKIYKFAPNMRLSPVRLLEATARGRGWKTMLVEADYARVGHSGQVAVEYTSDFWFERPVGVYPIWSAKLDTIEQLEELCSRFEPGRPIGRFFGDTLDMEVQEGQEHKVILRSFPIDNELWNKIFGEVSQIKAAYPEIRFHVHGGKSTNRTIGSGIDSYDHPVRLKWIDGVPVLMLPNGRSLTIKNQFDKDHKIWADLIGRSPQKVFALEDRKQLSRAAYEFNLLSLKWMNVNYDRVWTPTQGGLATDEDFDYESPDYEWEPKHDLVRLPQRLRRERFDRWLCDVCSIAVSCPYARPGAVCIVEDSPTSELVELIGSRRASDITEGLVKLLQVNISRLPTGLQYEKEKEKIDPNVTKLIDSIFDRGVQLAKIRDPQLAAQIGGGTKINIGMTAGQGGTATAILQASNPQELMAGVAARLEVEGIAIEDATEEDVIRVMGAIEAEASG